MNRIYDDLGYVYGYRVLQVSMLVDAGSSNYSIPSLRSPIAVRYTKWGDGNPRTHHHATCTNEILTKAMDPSIPTLRTMLDKHQGHGRYASFLECYCGFYHYYQPEETDLQLQRQNNSVNQLRLSALVVTRSWGNVAHHEIGFRSEYCQIVYGELLHVRRDWARWTSDVPSDDLMTKIANATDLSTVTFPVRNLSTMALSRSPKSASVRALWQRFRAATDYARHHFDPGSTQAQHLPNQIKRVRAFVKALNTQRSA